MSIKARISIIPQKTHGGRTYPIKPVETYKEITLEKFFPKSPQRGIVKLEILGSLFNRGCFWSPSTVFMSGKDMVIPTYSKKNIVLKVKKYGNVFTIIKFKTLEEKKDYLKRCRISMLY